MSADSTVRSAFYLAAIIESSDDAIVSKDLNGVITSWNRAACRMFGYEASEAIGYPIRMLIPQERQREEDEVLRRIRAGDIIDHFETVRVRKDGLLIDISLTVSPIRDADGTIIGASKIARDITEQRILAALAAAEAQNRVLAAVGETLAKLLDHRQMPAAVTQLLVPEFADWCIVDLISSDDTVERYPHDAPPAPMAAQVVRSGAPMLLGKVISVPLQVRATVIGAITCGAEASGRTYGELDLRLMTSIAERTALALENARAYEDAREANRLKDDFLATLSHELRTPLNAIMGYARMLRTSSVAPERRGTALDVIERNATALAQIVNDVLDISRVVTGKLALQVQPVPLSRLVDDAVATLLPAATAKGVHIRTNVGADVQMITADPDRLQQVLWNLLSNAVKFTARNGEVRVDVQRAENDVNITVTDTGEGISKEFLPYVFERFRQADTRMAGVRSGLGIGLAISRHIVEMHGGTIEADSEGVGKGSKFRIRLPGPTIALTAESSLAS